MTKSKVDAVNQLVFGADWACAHGDAGGLCDVAHRLTTLLPESFSGSLMTIAALANTSHGDPFATWAAVRPALVAYLADDIG